jgi:WD40 repeat protein
MDTQQVVARFEAERQALALMDHPNIAKVLDGGATDTGRPYFVMELVQGVPITEFCDKNRLPVEARIKLFIQVCQAIQSAHQKGIIHRDIKPTNILVTLNAGVAVPMVIDFGVAKATQQKLTEKTVFTNYATMIGTPAYMSPEQAEMSRLDVDTRSDIYGLGVLLYELLTGTTPFPEKRLRSASYQETQRIILEEEPERPSTRLRQTKTIGKSGVQLTTSHYLLATDLDWIVMKCLEKDRARRYETANGLTADLKRHLDNEPVVARPPSNLYRFRKLVRRNKLSFAAGAAVAAALMIGFGVATWMYLKERVARQQAVAAQKEAQQAKEKQESMRIEAEHQLYIAKMNLAQQAWEQNNVGQLGQLLKDTQDSPYRGFEWYFWQPLTRLASKTLRGHLAGVFSAAFSPDGRRIVTGSRDGTAKVWDAESGNELMTLKGHSDGVEAVAFSPDGQRIATGSWDGTAKVWDAATGHQLATLYGHDDQVWSVAYSPDAKRIVTGSADSTAKVWDAASGRNLFTLNEHKGPIFSVAFSPDSQRIVTGSQDTTAKVWDAASGKPLLTLKGHRLSIFSVAFSPDGRRIVTGSEDRTARVWDAVSGTNLLTLADDAIWSVAFSPDGQRIVTGSRDQTAKVWEAASGKPLFTFKGHGGQVWSVAFSPDGQRIVTGSYDQTAKLWDATNGLPADKPEGNRLTLRGHREGILSVAFSPDGHRIVTGSYDRTAKVCETTSGNEIFALKGHSKGINSVAFSPDGRRIVTSSDDRTAKVWDAATGQDMLTLEGHSDEVLSVAYSPDSHRIVTGSRDGTVKVWEAANGSNLLTFDRDGFPIRCVAVSPDGRRIVTGSFDHKAKVWEAVNGNYLFPLSGHNDEIFAVAFSPDGQRIVTGSYDQTAKVWGAASGTNLITLDGHRACVAAVAFSPDSKRIVTGSWDATAKLWEAVSGKPLLTVKGHSDEIFSVAFSPDGQRIVTGSIDGTARVWEAARPEQVAAWQKEDATADQYVAALRKRQEIIDQLSEASMNHAQSGRWAEAASDLARAIELNPTDHQLWWGLGAIYVQTGQCDAYRELCRKSVERFQQTTDPATATRIAKDSLILPGSGVNLNTISTMADTAVGQNPAYPFFQFVKGLAEFRQSRFPSATNWMGMVLTNSDLNLSLEVETYSVLAMSQFQLGQLEQARNSLTKGTEIEQKLPKIESGDLGDWSNWIIAHALMKEANAMTGSRPVKGIKASLNPEAKDLP